MENTKNTKNKFTPSTIGDMQFSIPLYQRLFEWESEQITQLLNDLYATFEQDDKQPYYIGMFTTFKENNKYSLVDGQQRFTVLTLMAIAFGWTDFVKIKEVNYRLSFFARKKDEDYLKKMNEKIVSNDNIYVNKKMESGLEIITNFVNEKDDKEDFKNYIYKEATFFISILPESYDTQDLNRYFESMNVTGKGLENHEILKVNLLKKLNENANKPLYTKIWNLASEMDKCLIRQEDKELIDIFRQKQKKALEKLSDTKNLFSHCKDANKNTAEGNGGSIKAIPKSSTTPKKQLYTRSERAILTFSEFLLQVLWLQLSTAEKDKTTDFFNIQKLQETFKNHLKDADIEKFMQNLLKYRILFDYYILRINHSEGVVNSYFLNFSDEEKFEDKKQLLQFQSMLYVSTTTHIWLTVTLEHLEKKPSEISEEDFLNFLKKFDNNRCMSRNIETLEYGSIDRYWFWRLDYYLWENRTAYFKDKSLKIADKYLFKINRSIEHIAPQTPKSNSNVTIDADKMDSFGNLAMISSGQNSTLQNESFEIKRAHVEAFINGSKNSSIESLKMLDIYENEKWSIEIMQIHSNKMINVLIASFPEVYTEIIKNFKNHLFENDDIKN